MTKKEAEKEIYYDGLHDLSNTLVRITEIVIKAGHYNYPPSCKRDVNDVLNKLHDVLIGAQIEVGDIRRDYDNRRERGLEGHKTKTPQKRSTKRTKTNKLHKRA